MIKKTINRLVNDKTGIFFNIVRKKSDKRKIKIVKFDKILRKRILFSEKKHSNK